jgi:hypothetical protein
VIETQTLNFMTFKAAVAKQFERMQMHPMFRVQVEKDELWATYLGSFPPGTNPIFRERTEYDCSCCRHFIRDIGDAVAVIDGELVSVWDAPLADEPAYEAVASALARLVKSRGIAEPFLHYGRTAGTDRNFEKSADGVKTWTHFFVNIAPGFVTQKSAIATVLSEQRSTYDVLVRSLAEITLDATDTVLEMIAQGSLYRGDEHKHALQKFRGLQIGYAALAASDRPLFVWLAAKSEPGSVARIRSTVIGTLLVDLSEGKDMEASVSAFEAKVAPTNYKRPTALVTKRMVEQAKDTVAELGLTSALERHYAVIGDVTINNVLFADRRARRAITGDVFDEIAGHAGDRAPKKLEGVDEVSIDRFVAEILPRAESVDVMFENRHAANLVSLIAPADPTAGLLFKWGNRFSWTYAGELADSIKERVKKAGGSVVGDLCCRLAWHNFDDLDFHMHEPGGGHIYFANRGSASPCGGRLDVDMNAGGGTTREPVENIFYARQDRMREGTYRLLVNQYNKRESDNQGFEVEIDWLGTVHSFAADRSPKTGEYVTVAEIDYTRKGGAVVRGALQSVHASRNVWGLPTETFHRVSVAMLSPNYWDGEAVGNKHYFFMLDGCANDGTARGFFNEFLMPAFDKHRKVFEIVGSKMKIAPASEQLSGLGFSSTQRNTLLCRVKGSFTRTIKIIF